MPMTEVFSSMSNGKQTWAELLRWNFGVPILSLLVFCPLFILVKEANNFQLPKSNAKEK